MSNKTKLKKTIAQVGYAPAQINTDTGVTTYGDVRWFVHNVAGGREYAASPNGETTSVYADGIEVYSAEENHGYDIDLTLLRVCDDVDEAWLNRVPEEDGVVEYATNEELPHFALVIIEDTTDGIGETNIWYDCHCTERPEENGKTKEGGGFDPEFPVYKIASRPRMSDSAVKKRISGKERFTKIPEPAGTTLQALHITNATLSPEFRGSVDTYTLTASGSTGVIDAIPASGSATVQISNGGTTVENGGTLTFANGTLTITVTNGEQSRTYTLTVKEA